MVQAALASLATAAVVWAAPEHAGVVRAVVRAALVEAVVVRAGPENAMVVRAALSAYKLLNIWLLG